MGVMICARQNNFPGQNLTYPGLLCVNGLSSAIQELPSPRICNHWTAHLQLVSVQHQPSNTREDEKEQDRRIECGEHGFPSRFSLNTDLAPTFVFFRRSSITASIGSCGFPRGFWSAVAVLDLVYPYSTAKDTWPLECLILIRPRGEKPGDSLSCFLPG